MKPTKNKVYCISIRRSKMLFESESKANNFIKFNKDEMLEETGKAPVRSYYCQFCDGWHITSNPHEGIGAMLDQKESQKISDIKELKSKVKAVSQEGLRKRDELLVKCTSAKDNLWKYINLGKFDKAREYYKEAMEYLMTEEYSWKSQKRTRIFVQHLNDILTLLVYEVDQEGELPKNADALINTYEYSKIKKNCLIGRKIDDAIQSLRQEVEGGNHSDLKIKVKRIESSLSDLIGTKVEKKNLVREYRTELEKIRRTLSPKSEDGTLVIKRGIPHSSNDGEDTVSEEQTLRKRPVPSEDLKYVISKIESVISDFNKDNNERCINTLEICDIILDEIDRDDDVTIQKLRGFIATWRMKIEMSEQN